MHLSILSVGPMLAFLVTIYLIFKHPTIRIPFTKKYIYIDYGFAPLIGLIVLFVTFSLGFNTIKNGILGSAGVEPYFIIILVMSLAYICISLDYTGFFEYLSLRVVRFSKNSSKRLLLYFFLLTAFLSLFTDNDTVILTMTLITFYMCRSAGINPIPFLFAQFFTVNIFGMTLYIGNPTNIVAAEFIARVLPNGFSFVDFAKWMILPSVVAAVLCIFLIWLIFRKSIPSRFKLSPIDPSSAIKDRNGALFGSVVLGLTVVFMSLPSSFTHATLWEIALFFAIVMFVHDVITYRYGISAISSRIPWEIVPFLIGLFIVIEALASTGWTELFGSQLSKVSGSAITSIFAVGFMSSLATGVMNNYPMAIFFVRAFQSPSFATLPVTTQLGSTLALIAGSNLGANLTLIGVLAGLMWAKILSDKGHPVSFMQFSKYGFLIMPIVIAVTCLVISIEVTLL
jgi:arsenical pump membrane protein